MSLLKKLIRLPFNLIGLQIVNKASYDEQKLKISYIILKSNYYYKEYLHSRIHSLNDYEYLQLLELKYGGYIYEVPSRFSNSKRKSINNRYHEGGDRMNVFFHDYSTKYSEYLSAFKYSNDLIRILEVGILRGTGLAIWSEYFNKKEIYGFDYDLGNFIKNKKNLLKLGAFKDGEPIIKTFDQFSDNSALLSETFGNKKLDVIIDDAFHSDESIINTFNELLPYLAERFIYFIEDNRTAWKKLKAKYPEFVFDYNDDELTVVYSRH
jgi:hypothetical protein